MRCSGDDGQYAARVVSTISFQRESGNPLHLRDVRYVPRLRKNLVSVAILKDKRYDVIFRRGKAYLQHLAYGCKKQIGLRVKNLYKLQVETGATLSSKVGSAQSIEGMVEQEQDRALNMEPRLVSQFQSKLVSSWANQQDAQEHKPRTSGGSHSVTDFQYKESSSQARRGDQWRVESPNIKNQPHRYTGHMVLMTCRRSTKFCNC